MRDAYESKARIRLKDIFNDIVHKRANRPNWLGEEMYNAMKGRLSEDKFKERSARAKVNRRAGNASGCAPASHCAGSVSFTQRAKKLVSLLFHSSIVNARSLTFLITPTLKHISLC